MSQWQQHLQNNSTFGDVQISLEDDVTYVTCDQCTRSEYIVGIFFRCLDCGQDVCGLCQQEGSHDQTHRLYFLGLAPTPPTTIQPEAILPDVVVVTPSKPKNEKKSVPKSRSKRSREDHENVLLVRTPREVIEVDDELSQSQGMNNTSASNRQPSILPGESPAPRIPPLRIPSQRPAIAVPPHSRSIKTIETRERRSVRKSITFEEDLPISSQIRPSTSSRRKSPALTSKSKSKGKISKHSDRDVGPNDSSESHSEDLDENTDDESASIFQALLSDKKKRKSQRGVSSQTGNGWSENSPSQLPPPSKKATPKIPPGCLQTYFVDQDEEELWSACQFVCTSRSSCGAEDSPRCYSFDVKGENSTLTLLRESVVSTSFLLCCLHLKQNRRKPSGEFDNLSDDPPQNTSDDSMISTYGIAAVDINGLDEGNLYINSVLSLGGFEEPLGIDSLVLDEEDNGQVMVAVGRSHCLQVYVLSLDVTVGNRPTLKIVRGVVNAYVGITGSTVHRDTVQWIRSDKIETYRVLVMASGILHVFEWNGSALFPHQRYPLFGADNHISHPVFIVQSFGGHCLSLCNSKAAIVKVDEKNHSGARFLTESEFPSACQDVPSHRLLCPLSLHSVLISVPSSNTIVALNLSEGPSVTQVTETDSTTSFVGCLPCDSVVVGLTEHLSVFSATLAFPGETSDAQSVQRSSRNRIQTFISHVRNSLFIITK